MNRNIATLAAGFALGLTGLSANASHIAGLSLFDGQDFTFDGTTYGGGSAFTASAIDFSYVADIDQTNAGPLSANFTETGVAFFSSFQQPLGTPVSAATTGLNNGYRMYGVFTAAATVFGDKTDVVIRGSGNIAFRTVPVPGVLGLMGAGLLGLGLVNRRRN